MSILKFKNKYKDKCHEDIYLLYYKIEPPICYCGNTCSFISLTKGYSIYCCSDCRQKKEKYNIENITKIIIDEGLNFSAYEMRQINKHLNLFSPDLYLMKYPNSNKCEVCGADTSFVNLQKGFLRTCSYKCGNSLPRKKLDDNQQNKANEKRKKTNLEKYGVEFIFQTLDNSGENNWMKRPDVVKKQHITMLERYGSPHALCISEFKEKSKISQIDKFGVDCVLKLSSFRETAMMEKYGVPYAMQDETLLNKFKDSKAKNLKDRRVLNNISGYVYLIYFENIDKFKIGLTGNFENRSKGLVKDFGEFQTILLVFTDNCFELEKFLHDKFKMFRVSLDEGCGKTEFFNIDKLDLIELPVHLNYEFLVGKELTNLT